MAKGDTKDALKDVKNDQNDNKTTGVQNQSGNDEETRQAGDPLAGDRESVEGAYKGMMSGSTPNVAPISSGRYSPIMSGYMGLAGDGGYSDESKANIGGDISGLREMGRTGGIDDASAARMRGGGVYDDMAKTGGYTDSQKADMMHQSVNSIQSGQKNTQNALNNRKVVQGGFSPGFDAASNNLRRTSAQDSANAALNARVGIQEQVNQNKITGAGGMSNSENALDTLKTGNQYRGLMGASSQEMGMNNSIAGNKLSALGGARGTADSMTGVDQFNAGVSGQNIDRNIAQQNLGTQGMAGLYSGDMSRYQGDLDRNINITGQNAGTNQGYYGARNPLAMQPGAGSNIMKGVTTAAGIGAGIMTGGGSMVAGGLMGGALNKNGGPSAYGYQGGSI